MRSAHARNTATQNDYPLAQKLIPPCSAVGRIDPESNSKHAHRELDELLLSASVPFRLSPPHRTGEVVYGFHPAGAKRPQYLT